MAKFYIRDNIVTEKNVKNAGSKARTDMNTLLEKYQYLPINIKFQYENNGNKSISFLGAIKNHLSKYFLIKNALSFLKSGDELVIQFPMMSNSIFFYFIIKNLAMKNIKITLLIHDIELIRDIDSKSIQSKIRIFLEEIGALKQATFVIAHNANMKQKLVQYGINEKKIIELDIFDYLVPDSSTVRKGNKFEPIIIAGNLSIQKAKYLNYLPNNINFNLYGVGYEDNKHRKNITYYGSFLPDDLLLNLQGSFGLVWDGDSINGCSGAYGNYLKFNNSHKASLYLAAGYPIIAWKESALSNFIDKYQCGFTVDSVEEIPYIINNLDDEKYQIYKNNTNLVSDKIRSGFFLKQALEKLIN